MLEPQRKVKPILTMKITDVDFSQTTGNSNNNANFGFRLWDKASGMQASGNSNYFMGLTVLDTYNSDRLQLALMSSNGTILDPVEQALRLQKPYSYWMAN